MIKRSPATISAGLLRVSGLLAVASPLPRLSGLSPLRRPLARGRFALACQGGALGYKGLKEDAGLPGDVDLG